MKNPSQEKKKHTSANSVYLVRAWLTPNAHPYFAPLRSAKHQIYANVSGYAMGDSATVKVPRKIITFDDY